jgi:hypothetical protein
MQIPFQITERCILMRHAGANGLSTRLEMRFGPIVGHVCNLQVVIVLGSSCTSTMYESVTSINGTQHY